MIGSLHDLDCEGPDLMGNCGCNAIYIAKPTPRAKVPRPLKSRNHRISSAVKDHVFVRDNFTCRWCEVPGGALDAHHIVPRSQGGKDRVTNLVSVHRLCHMQIHANPIEARRRGLIVGMGSNG